MELTACKWVLAIYLNAFSDLKKGGLKLPTPPRVHLHVCKQASFPRAATRAMERIPWLAAGKHRAESLSAARPLRGPFGAEIKFSALRFHNRVHGGDCRCLL